MSVFKYHAFIFYMRPPRWRYGTTTPGGWPLRLDFVIRYSLWLPVIFDYTLWIFFKTCNSQKSPFIFHYTWCYFICLALLSFFLVSHPSRLVTLFDWLPFMVERKPRSLILIGTYVSWFILFILPPLISRWTVSLDYLQGVEAAWPVSELA